MKEQTDFVDLNNKGNWVIKQTEDDIILELINE